MRLEQSLLSGKALHAKLSVAHQTPCTHFRCDNPIHGNQTPTVTKNSPQMRQNKTPQSAGF